MIKKRLCFIACLAGVTSMITAPIRAADASPPVYEPWGLGDAHGKCSPITRERNATVLIIALAKKNGDTALYPQSQLPRLPLELLAMCLEDRKDISECINELKQEVITALKEVDSERKSRRPEEDDSMVKYRSDLEKLTDLSLELLAMLLEDRKDISEYTEVITASKEVDSKRKSRRPEEDDSMVKYLSDLEKLDNAINKLKK